MGLFSSSFFRRKDVTHLIGEMNDGERLHRRLGPVALTGLGIGATIGTGLYVQTGFVAKEFAGPSLILSFLLAAIGCGFAALCYSELASMVPVAGSAYTYAYATLGELVAWIIGWDLILEYAIGSSVVAAGWSNYLDAFLHNVFHIPARPSTAGRPPGTTTCGHGTFYAQDGDPGRRPDGPGLAQPAGGLHHGGRHGRPGDRHQGKRGVQRGDGAAQHRGDPDGRRHRRGLRRPQELAAVLARGQGLAGRGRGGGPDLLRLHRVRLDLDPRRGGPATRSATWRSASWGR